MNYYAVWVSARLMNTIKLVPANDFEEAIKTFLNEDYFLDSTPDDEHEIFIVDVEEVFSHVYEVVRLFAAAPPTFSHGFIRRLSEAREECGRSYLASFKPSWATTLISEP